MNSEHQADMDRALDALGTVPSDVPQLIARYAGKRWLTPAEADALLATMSQVPQAVDPLSSPPGRVLLTPAPPAPVMAQAMASIDPKDGPPARRVESREHRPASAPRKAGFVAGLSGIDELPDLAPARLSAAKPEDSRRWSVPTPAAAPVAEAAPAREDTDSFEILVDEEILEIEPEDELFEDASDDE